MTCFASMEVNEFVLFRDSDIHGTGVFAKTKIRKGTRILEYTGEKISKEESAKRLEENNVFIFTLNKDVDLDGNAGWNPAKFVNHSCSPNCEAELADDENQIWIVTTRTIASGEEISFNYGYDLDDYKEHPCRCGATDCVGYMVAEEFFPKLKTILNKS